MTWCPPHSIASPGGNARGFASPSNAGREDLERVEQAYKSLGFKAELKSFFDDLPERLAKAHLVISRSGASSVAEMLVLGRPSILIPLPSSLEGDQLANAKIAEAAGAAWLMEEAELTGERLSDKLRLCLEKPDQLAEMAAKAKTLGRPDASESPRRCP